MTVRAINENGDWMFGRSMLDYKQDIDEIRQNIITSLKSWKGDCFFDLDAGVDWINYLGSYGNDKLLKQDIIRVVNGVEGVVNVEKYDAFIDEERKINIILYVNTIYGFIEINTGEKYV